MEAVVNDLLRYDSDEGWKLDLFVNIDEAFICALCENVCRDCVELSCEVGHSDQDFEVYCVSCLQSLFEVNGNKCPIDEHSNPSYSVSRSSRGRILKSMVRCPNSTAYKQSLQPAKESGSATTTNNESKKKKNNKNGNDCGWSGTLNALLKSHIEQCCESRTMSDTNMQLTMMKIIKDDIQDLEFRVGRVEKTQAQTAVGVEAKLGAIKERNVRRIAVQKREMARIGEGVESGKALRITLNDRLLQQNSDIVSMRSSISAFQQAFAAYQQKQAAVIQNIVAGSADADAGALAGSGATAANALSSSAATAAAASSSSSSSSSSASASAAAVDSGFSPYTGEFADANHGPKIRVVDANHIVMDGYVSSIRLSQGFHVDDVKNYYWYFRIQSSSRQNGYHFLGVCSNISSNFSNNPYDGLKDGFGLSGNPSNVFEGGTTVAVTNFGKVVIDRVLRIEYYGATKKLLFKYADEHDLLVYTMQLPTASSRTDITMWYPCMGIANKGNEGHFWRVWNSDTASNATPSAAATIAASTPWKKYDGYFEGTNHGSKMKVNTAKEVEMTNYISSIRMSKGIAVADTDNYQWCVRITSDSAHNGYHSVGMCNNKASSFEQSPYDGLQHFWGLSGNPKGVFKGGGAMVTVSDFNQSIVAVRIRCEYYGATKKLKFKVNDAHIYELQLPTTDAGITHWYPALSLANRGNKANLLD